LTADERASDVHNHYGDYNRLFTAFALALLGTGVAVVGIVLLAFDLAGDDAGVVLGTALGIKTATYVVVAPIASVVSGSVPKRRLMLVLLLTGASTFLLLPWVTSVWQLYALIFVFAVGSAIFNPTYQALVPYFLPEPRAYYRALTKARVANELESTASPLAAAILLLVVDHEGLFVAAMAIILLAAAILSKVQIPSVGVVKKAKPLKEVGRGLRLFRDTPEFRFLVPLNMAMALIVAMVMTNTVVLVQGLFDLGERETGHRHGRIRYRSPRWSDLDGSIAASVEGAADHARKCSLELKLPASRACSCSGGCSASDTGWPSRLPQSCFAVMAALKIAAFSMPRTSRLPILRCSSRIPLSAGSVQRSILRLSLRCSRRSQGLQFLPPSVLCAHQGAG